METLKHKTTRLKKRVQFVFYILLCYAFLSAGTPTISAQSEINLTVSPPVNYIHVPPGTNTTHTVVLENTGTELLTVNPTIVDFTTDGKSGSPILKNELSFPYISLGESNEVSEIELPPHKKAQLTLYINVPSDAIEQEYPLTILFFSSAQTEKNNSAVNSAVQGAIGSNLIVLVSKQNTFDTALKADIEAPTIIDSFQKLTFEPILQNDSLGTIVASGSAQILNWRKEPIANFDLYPDNILGKSSRGARALLKPATENSPAEIGSYSFKPHFLIGPYQIIVTATTAEGNVVQTIQVIYAIPFAIIVAVSIGIAISLYFAKTNRNN